MKEFTVLLHLTTGAVTAVQDRFGKTYRCTSEIYKPGDIVQFSVSHGGFATPTGEKYSLTNYRILAPVHHATVRALLNKSAHADKPLLPRQQWYEVISD